MSGIAKAIEDGVKQVAEHVGTRLGPKLKEFIEDTKNGMVKSAENTAKTEAENSRAIEGILQDGERTVGNDVERATTGLRRGTVKSRLSRALARLRQRLNEEAEDTGVAHG